MDLSEMPREALIAALNAYPHEIHGQCKIWLGPKRPSGYGMMRVCGKVLSIHRIAYFLAHGSIPDRHDVCHKCDTPSCFAEGHLFIGTRSQNMKDASAKKRLRCQIDPSIMPTGEDHPRAVLTEEQIMEIIFSNETNAELARKFNYASSNISKIRKGKMWVETVNRIRSLKTAPTSDKGGA